MGTAYRNTGNPEVDFKNKAIEQTLISHLPNGRERVEHRPQVKLDQIHFEQRAQVRITGINKSNLQTVRHSYENGVPLPSVVLIQRDNGDKKLIMSDGIHRYTAADELKWTHLPAFVCLDVTNDESVYLGGLFNAEHGLPASREERRRSIAAALRTDPPPTDDQLAKDFGVDRGTVNRIRREGSAIARLDRMGIPNMEGFSNSHLGTLERLDLDGPFRAMADLILDSGMGTGVAAALVGEVIKLPSETEQLERIQASRLDLAADIIAKEAGRETTGSPISDLRRMVTTFSKLIGKFDRPEQWVPQRQLFKSGPTDDLAPRLFSVLQFLGQVHGLMVPTDD